MSKRLQQTSTRDACAQQACKLRPIDPAVDCSTYCSILVREYRHAETINLARPGVAHGAGQCCRAQAENNTHICNMKKNTWLRWGSSCDPASGSLQSAYGNAKDFDMAHVFPSLHSRARLAYRKQNKQCSDSAPLSPLVPPTVENEDDLATIHCACVMLRGSGLQSGPDSDGLNDVLFA